MKQLGQLQKNKEAFDKLGVTLIGVLREETKGIEGLKIASQKASGLSPILLDTPVKKTEAYSKNDFATYFIGKDGKIKARLSGSKRVRPTGNVILKKAEEVFAK